MDIIIYFISLIHLLLVLFIILSPFSNVNYFLFINFLIIPFIALHWVLNNNTCCLTELEKIFYNKNDLHNGFLYRLINPIFNLHNTKFNSFLYYTMFILWSITSYNLHKKYKNNEIKSFDDLYII